MHPHLETAALTLKAAWAFGTAGAAALGALATTILGDSLPPGSERLLDLGFAGLFILALLYALRIVWMAKLESDKKYDDLEKEIRETLANDVKEANRTRAEMVELMRRKEDRDTHP